MQPGIFEQGVELMLYGMGTVILFLSLLVVATGAMSRLVGRYFPEPEPDEVPVPAAHGARRPGTVDDPQLLAVITAAIHRHRDRARR